MTNFFTALAFTVSITASSAGLAQRYFGTTVGFGQAKFITSSKGSDDIRSPFGNAGLISAFYEAPADSTVNFRFGMQYELQQLFYEASYHSLSHPSYKNLEYVRQQLHCSLDLLFPIVRKNSFKTSFLFGLSASYNIRTSAAGYGWTTASEPFTDANGDQHYWFVQKNFETNDRNSRDLDQLAIGLDFGMECSFRLHDRLRLLVQNKYNFNLLGVLSGFITVGLQRRLGK